MKRIISLLIIAVLMANSASAFAALEVTGPNIKGHEDWLAQVQADNLVGEILNGNIAFVAGCNRAWVNNGIVVMNAMPQYAAETKEFMLPTEYVNQFFGLSESTASATISSTRVETLTGKHVFIDPRGFILFSDKDSVVNTTVPTGYNSYRDYYTVADAMGYIAWEDKQFTEEERMAYINRWRGALSIPDDADRTEAANSVFISESINNAKSSLAKIVDNGDGTYNIDNLVLDGFDMTSSGLTTFKSNLYNAYKLLVTIAIGYNCYEDKNCAEAVEMRETILAATDYLLGYYSQGWDYNTDSKQNWTLSQFSLPIICSNLLCLMYDDMTDEQRKANTDQIFDKAPIPNVRTAGKQNQSETYTNRLWKCLSYFNTAVIANDTYRMNYALKYSTAAYLYSPRNMGFDELTFNKDGFYHDGSMIFHTHFPYNMGYGMSYAVLVYEFLEMTKDTPFDMRNIYGFDNVYDFCTENLLPFITHNQTMKMVHGRAEALADSAMLRLCAYIANNAPEEKRREISLKIKGILNGRSLSAGSKQYIINIPMLNSMKKKFDTYISALPDAVPEVNVSKVYYNQDQVVHTREDFTAALSMSSTRIAKYESLLNGNNTGWYLGDGMLYVYTDNDKQYNTTYFNTVNPYYMPGTTVDSTVRKEIRTDSATEYWGLPDNDWAGAVSDGENTVAGYQLGNKYVSGLEGSKSYFMFGDKIICMGTGIKGGEGDVYTVVENRIIDKPSDSIKPIEVGYDIKEITISNPDKTETVYQVADGNVNSSCPLGALSDWITFDLGEEVNIGTIGMAFLNGDTRKELATFQISNDGENFTDLMEFESSGETTDIELVDASCTCRYFRIVSHGNSRGNAWFNLAEIVFYNETATPEQIEESKLIISDGYDDLIIDSQTQEPVFNKASLTENPGWVWLEEQEGFVFLDDAKLEVMRERNPSSPVYMRMVIDHGVNPQGASYAYAELPKATLEETQQLAESDGIQILEMSTKAHAVYDSESGLIGANIFQKGVELEGITFNSPCCVLIDKRAGKIYLSDPTQTLKRLSFTLPDGVERATGSSVSMNGREVIVDTSVMRGAGHEINCRLQDTAADMLVVKVMNYRLRASEQFISTTLYAKSPAGGVSFEISKQPDYGRAMIFGDTLYYYSSSAASADTMTIRATDTAGNSAEFSVTVAN